MPELTSVLTRVNIIATKFSGIILTPVEFCKVVALFLFWSAVLSKNR